MNTNLHRRSCSSLRNERMLTINSAGRAGANLGAFGGREKRAKKEEARLIGL